MTEFIINLSNSIIGWFYVIWEIVKGILTFLNDELLKGNPLVIIGTIFLLSIYTYKIITGNKEKA